jgi:predicted Zn-dependent protease
MKSTQLTTLPSPPSSSASSSSRRLAGEAFVWCILLGLAFALGGPGLAHAAPVSEAQTDVLFRALEDELQRSLTLRLEDLDRPYFIQYAVDDTRVERVTASYGALTSVSPTRSRTLYTQVRVGSMELDNANFVGGRTAFNRRGATDLPLDDDYVALRQSIWLATDSHYKSAVETLTQKRAYLKDRSTPDRPADFTRATVVTAITDQVIFKFDRPAWEDYARKVSAAFAGYAHIQSSDVRIIAGVENRHLLNSEGTRLRYGSAEAVLRINAEAQAEDGERLSDEAEFFSLNADGLPPIEKALEAVRQLADRLGRSMKAPVLEDYNGPVLFDHGASPQLFRQLLSRGLAAQPDPVGASRRAAQSTDNLENRLGKRILPTSFRVYDDPLAATLRNDPLAGHYTIDDEGVPAQRVDLVVAGKLQAQLVSRMPTKRFTHSTGHGRRGSSEVPRAIIGNLFIETSEPKAPEDMKKALLKAADDEGLKYGLRVESVQGRDSGDSTPSFRFRRTGGAGRGVGDPVRVYKVFVADGREELVRGCEFRGLDERNLRRILAAGNTPVADQRVISSQPSSSVIAPAVLLEEVELTKIEREAERKPYLASPQARTAAK